ncbi:MAG: hypothetical protein FWE35_29395, partial [Streptosporangiales bacterium]|nr:hypothetical protein [Streptosporangiales bacterium]
CALALGVFAIRAGGWRRAMIAGVVLAAAAGSHLVPVVVVVFTLLSVGVAELLRGASASAGARTRLVIVRDFAAMGGISGVIWLGIRLFAGGTLGLGGASSPGSYNVIGTWFDPTEYLYTGDFATRSPVERSHFFLPGQQVLGTVVESATRATWPTAACVALLAGMLAGTVFLFIRFRDELGTIGIAGCGTLAFIIVLCLGFSFHYHVWVDATFGVRRMAPYTSFGLVLVGLGLAESALLYVDLARVKRLLDLPRGKLSLAEVRAKIAVQGSAAAVVPVVALTAWVAPTSLPGAMSVVGPERHVRQQNVANAMVAFTNWARADTPCGARFLVNSRPEGTMTALTGRFDLTEGMGSYLRPGTLPYVTSLMLSARSFYQHPWKHEAFLRQHNINYVVVTNLDYVLGYPGPLGVTNRASMSTAPFLHEVWDNGTVKVYEVKNVPVLPVSPLLQGPYLHCGVGQVGY